MSIATKINCFLISENPPSLLYSDQYAVYVYL